MKLSFEVQTDSVVICTISSFAIWGIASVAATQTNINLTCIATAGIAFVIFITFSLYNVDPTNVKQKHAHAE
jgi:hypothetical protein